MQVECTDRKNAIPADWIHVTAVKCSIQQAGMQSDSGDQDEPNSSDCLKQLTVQASQDPNHARFLVSDYPANKKEHSRAPFNAVALPMQKSNEPVPNIFIKCLMRTKRTYIHWSRFPKFPFLTHRKKIFVHSPPKIPILTGVFFGRCAVEVTLGARFSPIFYFSAIITLEFGTFSQRSAFHGAVK